jgi:hypothetical protein
VKYEKPELIRLSESVDLVAGATCGSGGFPSGMCVVFGTVASGGCSQGLTNTGSPCAPGGTVTS